MIAVLFTLAFAASPASAVATNIHGYGFYENGSPAWFDSLRIINTNTSVEWNQSTTPQVVIGATNYYLLRLDDPNDVQVGHVLRYIATNGTWTNDSTATYTGLDFEYNITFIRTLPDLIVESITTPNDGYVFANESNKLCATIKNNGTGNAGAFNVSFEVGTFYDEVRVQGGLDAGKNITVCVTDPTLRNHGDSVTINVTADCNGEVSEGVNENNNASSITKTVKNQGYKGKTYTGGNNMTTWKTLELKGDLLYSTGDSKYMSGSVGWKHMNVTWTASDLPVPSTATGIKEARLYVPYCWAKDGAMPNNYSMEFNGNPVAFDKHYWDTKWYDREYPYYGMLVYNVTAYFNTSGNTANLTSLWSGLPSHSGASINGMVLVVVYEDDTALERKILINEEFDMLGTKYGVTPEEATAYAPLAGSIDLTKYKWGKLITIAPGASGPEGNLTFNGQKWTDVWTYAGTSHIGIDERDVSSYLQSTNNLAEIQISAGYCYMEASNAILVLTVPTPVISVEPEETIVQPQDQFDVNITVNPNGARVYGVEYYLHYNPSVVRAETQNKGPFLGGFDDTIVVHNEIDHTNGIVSYAETRKVPDGVVNPGTLATIQFTAIGKRGATTGLNLTGVIIVNYDDKQPFAIIKIENGTVKIYDNRPPEAKGHSMFRYNYAAKKFESLALLCSNSTNPDELKGYNITYVRWSFGDGQYGTSEGGLPDDARDGICVCKDHAYTSWKWNSTAGEYEPFNASVTVTDDGCPEASDTAYFDVMVHMAGDANGDGVVNILDAVYVGKHFGDSCNRTCTPRSTCCEHPWADPQQDAADMNNDCKINILDAVIVGTMWGHTAY